MTGEEAFMFCICIVFAGFALYGLSRWIAKIDKSPFRHCRDVDNYRSSMRDHSHD